MRTLHDIAIEAERQDIGLHANIAAGHYSGGQSIFAPTDLLLSITEAGHLLRTEPGPKLARKPLDTTAVPEIGQTAGFLIDMVNASVNRDADAPVRFTYDKKVKALDTCKYAEKYYAATILNLLGEYEKDPDDIDEGLGCEVITDEGEPVMLRKSFGETTSLSLARIVINGVPYPAGSILRVETLDDEPVEGGLSPTVNSYHSCAVDLGRVANVSFLRLSAFALGRNEREQAFGPTRGSDLKTDGRGYYTDQEVAFIFSTDMAEIRQAARLGAVAWPPEEDYASLSVDLEAQMV